jgi:acetate kinase
MNILAVNCGSTSLKFRLTSLEDRPAGNQRRIVAGAVTDIGPAAQLDFNAESGEQLREQCSIGDISNAIKAVLDWLSGSSTAEPYSTAQCASETIKQIGQLEELAPLHNAPAIRALRAVEAALGKDVPSVAVFDTTFHRTMPARAALYALPLPLMQRHGIRRYGFHGLAHRSMMQRYAELEHLPLSAVRLITIQLGGGCSVCAIDQGRSVDTSMGFTPLEGLMMGTRSGDLDPSLPAFLGSHEDMSAEAVERLLNSESGLLGVSGHSDDVRGLLKAEKDGDERSGLALEMFCYRVRKTIGAYLAILGGTAAVVFGGGIGEHQPPIRDRICEGFGWCGLRLDSTRNTAASGETLISTDDSRIAVYVIPSDEESIIIDDTAECLRAV